MIKNLFRKKSVLITGATGSIGSSITERILRYNCKVIRAMSNDENGIYGLIERLTKKNESLKNNMKKNKIRYLIGDIRDYKRCAEITKGIDIVIHAAALKHVPICEYNPEEAKKTNIIGTKNLIKASVKNKVKKFLFVSTDKVVNPKSIMGFTKKEAEQIVIKNNEKNCNTLFSVIRFGNIIGSRGSVLLKFLSQVKDGKSITVTDRNITRFFITIDKAVKEIFNSIQIMKGSEIFIVNKIPSFKIYDLANVLKNFYKSKKKIVISGLREGEKIFEELISANELKYCQKKKNLIIIKNKKKKNSFNHKNLNLEYNSRNARLLDTKQILSFLKQAHLI